MPNRNLALGTISFAICFAAWGLISAFAPSFQADLHLSAQMRAFLIAVPVLLGSLGAHSDGNPDGPVRRPHCVHGPVLRCRDVRPRSFRWPLISISSSALRFCSGSPDRRSRSVSGFVSRWFPPEQQGTALGIFGLGNMGHSAAVFLGPVAAAHVRPGCRFLRRQPHSLRPGLSSSLRSPAMRRE